MKNFAAKFLLGFFFAFVGLATSASTVHAKCDNWADSGSEHRNAGNGCVYRCEGSNWQGPLRCDGQGNGQFQGEPAKNEAERQNQARAVEQAMKAAEQKVAEQGAAQTAAMAAATAEMRQKEAVRQQAMVEAQRQAAIADAQKRMGAAAAAQVAQIDQKAKEAAAFVSQAQGTDRGQNIVGSGAQNAAAIAEAGYDPNGALATGKVSVSGNMITEAVSKPTAASGGTGGGGGSLSAADSLASDVAKGAMYKGADWCDVRIAPGTNLSAGAKCCRGGAVECGSGTCVAGSIGQYGQCSGSDSTKTPAELQAQCNAMSSVADKAACFQESLSAPSSTNVRSIAMRDTSGKLKTLAVTSTSNCSEGQIACTVSGLEGPREAGGYVCVDKLLYGEDCNLWKRDFTVQQERGIAIVTAVPTAIECKSPRKECILYGGGAVCIDGDQPCSEWKKDFESQPVPQGTDVGRVNFKITGTTNDRSCERCVPTDSADVCRYQTVDICQGALEQIKRDEITKIESKRDVSSVLQAAGLPTTAPFVRWRLDNGICRVCNSAEDIAKYGCTFSNALCSNSNSNVKVENCPSDLSSRGNVVVYSTGVNRQACVRADGQTVYFCTKGNAANQCATLPSPEPLSNKCNARHGTEIGSSGSQRYCCNGEYSATACSTPISVTETLQETNRCTGNHGVQFSIGSSRYYCCNGLRSSAACSEPLNLAKSQMNGQSFAGGISDGVHCGNGSDALAGECGFCKEGKSYESGGKRYCGVGDSKSPGSENSPTSNPGKSDIKIGSSCLAHGSRVITSSAFTSPENYYCCDGKVQEGQCSAPATYWFASPATYADGTWCNDGIFGSCQQCISSTTYEDKDGKKYCGSEQTSRTPIDLIVQESVPSCSMGLKLEGQSCCSGYKEVDSVIEGAKTCQKTITTQVRSTAQAVAEIPRTDIPTCPAATVDRGSAHSTPCKNTPSGSSLIELAEHSTNFLNLRSMCNDGYNLTNGQCIALERSPSPPQQETPASSEDQDAKSDVTVDPNNTVDNRVGYLCSSLGACTACGRDGQRSCASKSTDATLYFYSSCTEVLGYFPLSNVCTLSLEETSVTTPVPETGIVASQATLVQGENYICGSFYPSCTGVQRENLCFACGGEGQPACNEVIPTIALNIVPPGYRLVASAMNQCPQLPASR